MIRSRAGPLPGGVTIRPTQTGEWRDGLDSAVWVTPPGLVVGGPGSWFAFDAAGINTSRGEVSITVAWIS